VEVVISTPGPLWSGENLYTGVGPGKWATQMAESRQDLGPRIRESFVARVLARKIHYSHRGRSLSRPQVQARAARLAAKVTTHTGDVIDVRL
jgi:hypothetical protein